jgi:hypothetical protein
MNYETRKNGARRNYTLWIKSFWDHRVHSSRESYSTAIHGYRQSARGGYNTTIHAQHMWTTYDSLAKHG